ncbi:MAG TPA: GNAT family N-acetyltransferase [Trebonia sp.]|nr:GNAT family N-acetyltransferase [Trebonia sp.]
MTAAAFPEPGITDLERVAAAHWRGTEEEWLGQWLLRAADGFTGRANSALPLGDPGMPLGDAVDYVTRWYADRGLRPMIALPVALDAVMPASELDAELVRRSWPDRGGPAYVMVADIDDGAVPGNTGPGSLPAGLEFRADPVPDEAWLATYHYRGGDSPPPVARKVLTSAAGQLFLSIRSGDDVAAIARLSLAEGWAGITAVEVAKTHRRAGLGSALNREAFAQAAARGVHRVFLQVEVGNAPARSLYERNGFRYAHRYHYRLAPAPAG